MIDKFGVQGVYGRPLDFGEIIAMELAAAVQSVYKNMEQSTGWATWQNEHPNQAALYNEAMMAALEQGYDNNG